MKKLTLTIVSLLLFSQVFSQPAITGKWKTFDDETNEVKSIVEVFEKSGKFYGRVVKLFRTPAEDPDPVCTECETDDPRFNKKIIGMEILKDMKKSGAEFSDGTVLDPKNGKVYRCKIWMEESDLKLRGYLGPFYRTQTWKRAD